MSRRDGHYDGDDGYVVRVREKGAARDGSANSEFHGRFPEKRARQIAAELALERGGRVTEDRHALTVVVGQRGSGRPPVGPMISLRFPRELVAALDAHAAETGTTRSALLRRGAEMVLAEDIAIERR